MVNTSLPEPPVTDSKLAVCSAVNAPDIADALSVLPVVVASTATATLPERLMSVVAAVRKSKPVVIAAVAETFTVSKPSVVPTTDGSIVIVPDWLKATPRLTIQLR